jgi:tetratricopeptide (TPR) repeat protein
LSWGHSGDSSAGETTVLYMHRLVQEVIQKSFAGDLRWLTCCLDLVYKVIDWLGRDGLELKNTFELESFHTIKIAEKAYDVFANDNKKLENIAKLYFYNGVVNAKLLFMDAGLSCLEKCIQIFEKICDEENCSVSKNNLLFSYMNKGYILFALLKYHEAVKFFDKSIQLGEQLKADSKLDDECILAKAYMGKGCAYERMKLYNQALSSINKSIDIYERLYKTGCLSDENDLALIYINRAVTYDSMTKYDAAFTDGNKAKEILEKLNNEGKSINNDILAKVNSVIAVTTSKVALKKDEEYLSNIGNAIYNQNRLNSELNYWKKRRNNGGKNNEK